MENVIYADVKGYEGLYKVTSDGAVINAKRKTTLKQSKGASNYYKVGLSKNGKTKYIRVHRIVAEAFIPNEENKPQVDHIDGDYNNNRLENLRWATPKENINNPVTLKRRASTYRKEEVREQMSASHKLVEERKKLFRAGDTRFTSTGKLLPS